MKKEIDPDLSAEELADLILEKPETTEQCGRDDWLKLTGDEWVRLLSELPQFADKCPWNLLPYECYKEFCGWEYLLERQPQFAEKCNWERMPGHSVLTLLRKHPSLAKYVAWDRLDGINWCCLLKESPQYGQYCDWKKLDGG